MLLGIGIVYLWLRPRQTSKLWPLLPPLLIAIHLALPATLGAFKSAFFPRGGLIAEQETVVRGNEAHSNNRIADIGPSMRDFRRHPLLGQGFGSRIVLGPHSNAPILDDQWLGTLLEVGLIGTLGWIVLFGRSVRRLGRVAKKDDSDRGWLAVALAASITAFAVGMLTYDAFSFIQVTLLAFIVLALGAIVASAPNEPDSRSLGLTR
jgi:O-antigen ligase